MTIGLAMLASLYEDAPYVLTGYLRRMLRSTLGARMAGTHASVAGLPLQPLDTTPVWSSEPSSLDAGALDSRLRGRNKSR